MRDMASTSLDNLTFGWQGFARQMAESAPVRSAAALRDAMAAAEAAGCDEFFLVPTTADPAELDRTRDALGI